MQVKLTNIETEVSITPQKIADWFWGMSANEQSNFFAYLQKKGTAFEFQMAAVNSVGDIEALKNMEIIGTYGINCGLYVEAVKEYQKERIDQIKDIAMISKRELEQLRQIIRDKHDTIVRNTVQLQTASDNINRLQTERDEMVQQVMNAWEILADIDHPKIAQVFTALGFNPDGSICKPFS